MLGLQSASRTKMNWNPIGLDAFPNQYKNVWFVGRFGYLSVLHGVGYTEVRMYGNGCLPRPLQKGTVWWSFWALVFVLCAGVHKASNVRKCRFKHIQLYRLENVGLKVFLTSSWNPKVWMPSQTITKTDGLVVVLDTFVFSSFVIFYRSVSFVLRLSFQHVCRIKCWMPS